MAGRTNYSEAPAAVETTDRGMFDFLKKKDDHPKTTDAEGITSGIGKVHVSEPVEEKKHESLLEKMHHDDHSSSSSDEEGGDEEKKQRRKEKKERKAGLTDKIKEKFGGRQKDEHDTNVPIEKVHVQENVYNEPSYGAPATVVHHQPEEKESLGDKIKDKLPTSHDHNENVYKTSYGAPETKIAHSHLEEGKKESIVDKVKDKFPGHKGKGDEHDTGAGFAPVTATEAHHTYGAPETKIAHSHLGEEKKEGIVDKVKDKFPGHKGQGDEHDTGAGFAPVTATEAHHTYGAPETKIAHSHLGEEKKEGIMDKVKDKFPGHKDKYDEHDTGAGSTPMTATEAHHVEEDKEKKGFLDKIKDKIPGFHSKTDVEEKKELGDDKKEGY